MLNLREYLNKILKLTQASYWDLFVILIFFTFSSLMDLLGIGFLSIYATLLISPEIIFKSNFLNNFGIIDSSITIINLAIILGISLIIIFTVKLIISTFIYSNIFKFTHSRQKILRKRLLESYKKLSYEKFIFRDSSESISSIGVYVKQYGSVINALLLFIGDMIIAFFIVILLVSISGPIFLIMIFVLFSMIYLYKIFFINNFRELGENLNEGYKNIYQGVQEYFDGFKEINVLDKYAYFENKILHGTDKVASSDIRQSVVSAIPKLMIELAIVFFIVIIVSLTLFKNNEISSIIPILTVFAAASIRLAPMFNQISRFLSVFNYGRDSIIKIYNEIYSNLDHNEEFLSEIIDQSKFISLEIKNLSYSYPKSNIKVLKNISLKIKAGEAIAITGPSGSGKTTLIDIILGLLKPNEGEIILNNVKVNKEKYSLKNKVAYLPQEIFLVNDTIINNVALGKNIEDIDIKKVEESLEKAQLGEFIKKQINGIKTIVGQKGINLSGGQKQRVALARAFYYNREVIFFDEATSALDKKMEEEIINQIKLLKGNRTVIIISHNEKTIRHCDRIYNISSGRLEGHLNS